MPNFSATFSPNEQLLGALGLKNGEASYAWLNVGLTLLEGIIVIVATVLVARVARSISRGASRNALWDVQLVLLVGRLVYIAVLVLGFLALLFVVAPQLLAPVIGAVGLLGLAFGLAFQDILKNWISGFFLLLERPFRIGDEITVGGFSGSVETIRLRVTALRTLDAQRILVPNQMVYTSAIVDASSYPVRQFTTLAGVTTDRPLKDLLQEAEAAVGKVEGVATEPPPEISLVPNVEHGAAIEVRYWVETEKFKVRGVIRELNALVTGLATGQMVGPGDLGLTDEALKKPSRPAPTGRPARRARAARRSKAD
ncbi:MAG TPA: mechanosensitive ion channel domain-containing protein [Candidatus Dormibacteraeota bacterium]|nr:mechanosensitive ion channel domain-containing protein [Candidatus Dormibacteraeota bacterium]